MAGRAYQGGIDHARLGKYMRALSVPTRILLLERLKVPRTATEIDMPPFRKHHALRSDRRLTRQTITEHLGKLEGVGLVRSRTSSRDGKAVREYLVNPSRLFSLAEDIRQLASLRMAPASSGLTFQDAADETAASPSLPRGACLVHISGPFEGDAIPLRGKGPWIIGRSPDAEVRTPFDAYVSAENTRLWRHRGRLQLQTLPESRNGTMVNWRSVRPSDVVAVRSGDTVGVGRSLFLVRDM